jgi:N-acetylated-alpha-linked acidic dipeptidase
LSQAELEDALPKIPCTPIGWAEAEMIQAHLQLRDMMGAEGHDVQTPIGPGPALVHLVVDQPRDLRTIRNVIATLPGASEDCVIAGAHRDAWVRGANDDGSGVVCMIRAAQRLAEKVKSGWKPANTIMIALWDAEEFGMIGSTEWAEAHADMITQHCFAYVNSDTGCSGTHFRGASGTPGLLRVLKTALERVPTPEPRKDGEPKNLWEDWGTALKPGEPTEIEPAGSGSDFVAFLHHLSRPVVDISLSGNRGGQYHTSFDDFAMVERYLDPGFVGHEMCGQLIAELLLELDAQGPRKSFDSHEAMAALAALARKTGTLKDPGESTPWLGGVRAERIARALEQMGNSVTLDPSRPSEMGDPTSNTLVPHGMPELRCYEELALDGGIAGRSWFRNPIWTPGLEDGYGSEYFPELRAAAKRGSQPLDHAVDQLVEKIGKAVIRIPSGKAADASGPAK